MYDLKPSNAKITAPLLDVMDGVQIKEGCYKLSLVSGLYCGWLIDDSQLAVYRQYLGTILSVLEQAWRLWKWKPVPLFEFAHLATGHWATEVLGKASLWGWFDIAVVCAALLSSSSPSSPQLQFQSL